MKSERRHELQHNTLLDWMTQTYETIKPHLNAILLGVVVLLGALVAYRWMSSQSAASEAAAWDMIFMAMNQGDAAQLDQVVQTFPDTDAAEWAAVLAGDFHLNAGCEQLFTTKATATDEFQDAQERYRRVLDDSQDPLVRERATYGLARTFESMAATRRSQEELKQAKELYQKVVTNWPDGAYAKNAQARLDSLNQDSTLEFYDALAAWEPKPSGMPTGGPEDLNRPFDELGEGLEPGSTPENFFGDITDKLDESIGEPTGGEAEDGITVETDSTEIPLMPEAAGSEAASEAAKPEDDASAEGAAKPSEPEEAK